MCHGCFSRANIGKRTGVSHCRDGSGTLAVCSLLLLAAVVVMGMAGSAEAGKKKRSGSLQRLRERNVSQRWKDLQQTWRPIPTEAQGPIELQGTSNATDGIAETPLVDSDQPTWRRSASAANAGGLPTTQDSPASTFGSLDFVETLENSPALPAPDQGRAAQPIWEFGADLIEIEQDMKRTAITTSVAASAMQSEGRRELASLDDARPKPITSILPYHDYSPDGKSPCEFLCPTPDGCPDDGQSKPCPELVALPDIPFEGRAFADTHVTWEASNLFSNPLYFEDASLERYGHTHHELLQPLVSLGKFGVQFVGLPYQMALHPIHEHRYALGWYRPGECAPYKYYLPPWNTKAALTAGAVYTGLFYVIP